MTQTGPIPYEPSGTAFARLLTESARAVHAPRSLGETVGAIVVAAREALPAFDHVGVALTQRDGTVATEGASGELVRELDGLQYSFDEGPCLDSLRGDPLVVMEAPHAETRWPRYAPEAVRRGVRAQLGVRLEVDGTALGSLNLYALRTADLGPEVLDAAELFAAHAAIALERTRYEHQLDEALATRKLIGQAIGIVMERYQITEARAFEFLTRASTTSNTKLRAVAAELVEASERTHRGTRGLDGEDPGPV